jgi:hypothetical protein
MTDGYLICTFTEFLKVFGWGVITGFILTLLALFVISKVGEND